LTPYWLIQGVRHGKYLSNLKERLGWLSGAGKIAGGTAGMRSVHAVSVGEGVAGVNVGERLKRVSSARSRGLYTTITGQKLAKERMPFADGVIYFPLDWAFFAPAGTGGSAAALVVVLETEIWPILASGCAAKMCRLFFVTVEFPDRSFARSTAG